MNICDFLVFRSGSLAFLSLFFQWTFTREGFPKLPSKYPLNPRKISPLSVFSVLTPGTKSIEQSFRTRGHRHLNST